MKTVDYSDRAITMRLRQVSELRKLCLSLGKANPKTRTAESSSDARQRSRETREP